MERYELPKGWKWKKIGSIAQIISGSTPRTDKPEYWNGDILWATPKDLGKLQTIEIDKTERTITQEGLNSCSAQLLPPGSVLLTSRAPIGHLAINTKPMATNQGFKNLLPNSEIYNRYLYWVLKFFVREIQHIGRGATFAEISKPMIASFEIPVPPLSEQKRIVSRIEELSRRVEEVRRLRREAVTEAEGYITAAIASIFAEGQQEGWLNKKVKDICHYPQYGYTASAQHNAVGPKFLRITDIQNGKVDWETVPYCYCPDIDKYRLQTGDIVFARTGATTGKSFLVTDPPEAVFASYLIRLRVGPAILPEFLYWYFQSSLYWEGVFMGIEDGNRPNMNGTKLANLVVPFPADLNEQRRIVEYLNGLQAKADELKRLQAETEAELAAFTPALLAKAFRGEL